MVAAETPAAGAGVAETNRRKNMWPSGQLVAIAMLFFPVPFAAESDETPLQFDRWRGDPPRVILVVHPDGSLTIDGENVPLTEKQRAILKEALHAQRPAGVERGHDGGK